MRSCVKKQKIIKIVQKPYRIEDFGEGSNFSLPTFSVVRNFSSAIVDMKMIYFAISFQKYSKLSNFEKKSRFPIFYLHIFFTNFFQKLMI